MVRRCLVNFKCQGILLVWIIVGQGPTALAVGVDGGCSDILSPTLGDGPISTEIMSKRAGKPNATKLLELRSSSEIRKINSEGVIIGI